MIILDSLKELFARFQEEHPSVKIGFSKFCELRPRWCVTAQAPGTLNVCVCIKHQNPKLQFAALNPSLKYRDMLAMLVCSIDDEECMNNRCENCPDPSVLTEHLRSNIQSDEIIYSIWKVKEGQTVMEKDVKDADEFIEGLSQSLQELCRHHFVCEKQGKFFKSLKERLTLGECIVLLDWAENHKLLIQDEVQSHHWSGQQATLHNMVVYYIDAKGDLQHQSFCFISDYLSHDVPAVHASIQDLVPRLKDLIPNLQTLYFFSDGGPVH